MADVALDLEELTAPELIATAHSVASGLKDNPQLLEPVPPVEELHRLTEALKAIHEQYLQQRSRLNELKMERDKAMSALQSALLKEVEYVQQASGGDPTIIMSANLHIEHTWHMWPFGSVEAVHELAASAGDAPGEIEVAWDPIRGAIGYEVELSRDIGPYGPWKPCGATDRSAITIKDLASRQRYWFRVRAIGENGSGDWSDPVTKFAP